MDSGPAPSGASRNDQVGIGSTPDFAARLLGLGFEFQTAGAVSRHTLSQDTPSRSRRTFRASFAIEPPALRSEGAGNAGRPMRPIAACAEIVVASTRVGQVTPESSGIPRAMVLRLMSYSPRRSGFFVTVTPEKLASHELDASVEASGPHDFAVRLTRRSSKAHQRPPHPIPHS